MKNQLFRKKSIQQILSDSITHGSGLAKVLGVRDLVSLGIAAIVGAGIFSTIGLASFNGGPAVSLLFVFVAFACVFTALSYAQFASTVPVSGSAYTYAYVAFGELFAWIIGWALVLEYAVSNMVVAISWSQYFVSMCAGFGLHIPRWLTMAPGYALDAHDKMIQVGLDNLTGIDRIAIQDYETAPRIGDMPVIFDLPAGLITVLVTWLVYVGIKESQRASNIMVIIKIGIILAVLPSYWAVLSLSRRKTGRPLHRMALVVCSVAWLLYFLPLSVLIRSRRRPRNVKIRKEICPKP